MGISPNLSRLSLIGRKLRTGRERSPRLALLLAIVATHLLLILWLVSRPPIERHSSGSGETLISIAPSPGDRAAREQRKPVAKPSVEIPAPVPPAPIELPSPLLAAADTLISPGDAAPGSGGCQLDTAVGAAVEKDPASMAELAALPPGPRTSADVVLLWNGAWLETDSLPIPAVAGTMHRLVEQIVMTAPAECRDAPLLGPRFIPVAENGHTTMLVIGSGAWRWSDLIAPPSTCRAGSDLPCLERAKPL